MLASRFHACDPGVLRLLLRLRLLHTCEPGLKVKATAKPARLKAEMDFLDKETEVRRLQLAKEIAIANAEERAINQVLDEENCAHNTDTLPKPVFVKQERTVSGIEERENAASANVDQKTGFKINPLATPFIPKSSPPAEVYEAQYLDTNAATLRELVSIQVKQTELSSLLINQQKTSNLLVNEPPVFAGDPFNYPSFIAAFRRSLHHLRQSIF